jgi:hypothetical protein
MALDLELILEYGLSNDEALSYKLALIWVEYCEKEFPGYKFIRLKKGDPRKSILFKYCYKLVQETKGLLPLSDYRLYIIAQLRTLKEIKEGEVHALIDPIILVGKRAWWRWKSWKKLYDKKIEYTAESGVFASEFKVMKELDSTKEFLEKRGLTTKESILKALHDGLLPKWVYTQKVSPYYIVLSKSLNNENKLNEIMNIDLNVYRCAITPKIREYFKEMFKEI